MLSQKIVLVSNNKQFENVLFKALLGLEYQAIQCQDIKQIQKMLGNQEFGLILIDLDQNCSNEWDITLNIRKITEKPIIIGSYDIEECKKLLGYELINDFIKKPYNIEEVICRVQIQLNRIKKGFYDEQIKIDDLVIDLPQRKVLIKNNEVNLTEKEFEILKYLVLNSDRVISREELVEKIWKEKFKGNFRTVDTHIKKLRKKIDKYSSRECISTVWGCGYRMNSILMRINDIDEELEEYQWKKVSCKGLKYKENLLHFYQGK